MAKLSVKKGDNVLVIVGKDKGKTGKILVSYPKDNRVLVEKVNIVTKAKKPKNAQEKGGIFKEEAPIDASNVMVLCPACGKATRVAHAIVDGKKVRTCKKCGGSLDVAKAKKVAKKEKSKAKADKVDAPAKEAEESSQE